jgi:ribosome-associated protein
MAPALDRARDLAVRQDRPDRHRGVSHHVGPMRVEGLAITRGKCGHGVRTRVPLVLEEDRQVTRQHLAQFQVHARILNVVPEPREIAIRGDMIRLGQLLKLADLVDSGGELREFLADEEVLVNGEPDNRRGRQLHPGDVVTLTDVVLVIVGKQPV